jgi:peptide/nickel transport system permease protein
VSAPAQTAPPGPWSDAAIAARRPQSPLSIAIYQLRRNRGAIIGAVALSLLVLMAIFAPLIAPYDPIEIRGLDSLKPPSREHWMGTDLYGRDILSRVIFGARISLTIGLISVGIAMSVGVPTGLIAGWYRGWLGGAIMRVVDAMLAMPGMLLALSIIAVLGPGLTNAMIAVGIGAIPTYVRLVHGSVLSARENLYVDAARVVGCGTGRIMFRHILPNVVAPVIVLATLGIATAILSAASLSFLGLGAQPPTPDWGTTVSEGRNYLSSAPWICTFPSLVIMVAVLSINLLGDGLRDALDPRFRGR